MNVGELDHRVKIEYQAVTYDPDFGTPITTWTELATVWANVQDALPSKAEAVVQGLNVAINQTRVRIRWRDDVDSSMRMIISRPDPVTYEIVGGPAQIGGRRGYSEFMVERLSS
jgi:SPP1 family predicted phage head-tail adaptor